MFEFKNLVRRLPDFAFANEDLGKFFPLRRLRIKAIERTNRGLVLDIRLHHAAVAHNRFRNIFELHFVDLCSAKTKFNESVRGFRELIEFGVVKLRNIGPTR